MSHKFLDVTATPSVRAAQAANGSRAMWDEYKGQRMFDRFTEELGTDIATTLNLYMRLMALQRLLATKPMIARLALDAEEGGTLRESALVAAARLDLYVRRDDDEGSAEFDADEFRDALEDEPPPEE